MHRKITGIWQNGTNPFFGHALRALWILVYLRSSAFIGGFMGLHENRTGFDASLKARRRRVIGGGTIPHARGLDGHSAADVLLHAICDALIGASALGDIGTHFPDSDSRYEGIDSRKLLRETAALLAKNGWRLVNLDETIIAQEPRMAPHIPAMIANIAADLAVPQRDASIKAKTTENPGFAGRGEAIAAGQLITWPRRNATEPRRRPARVLRAVAG